MPDPSVPENTRKQIEAEIRALHHYGDPPDVRLKRDVDLDVEGIMELVDTLSHQARQDAMKFAARIAETGPNDRAVIADCIRLAAATEAEQRKGGTNG